MNEWINIFYYYVYIKTHTYSIYFENIYIYIIYKYINIQFFLNIYMHVFCIYIYT